MSFKRMEGFAGSVPQKFIDNRVPKCPMCNSNKPHWHIDMKMGKMSFDPQKAANKYHFQCQECQCILESPVTDVTGIGRTSLSVFGLAKKLSGKKTNAIYLKVINVGTHQLTSQFLNKELTLEELNQLAENTQ